LAAGSGHAAVVECLLRASARADAVTWKGVTPLDLAREANCLDVVALLQIPPAPYPVGVATP
jgi:hypothetical protein